MDPFSDTFENFALTINKNKKVICDEEKSKSGIEYI
jgi:hypothetical protein